MASVSAPEGDSAGTLGHYRLLEPIGTGGMGMVYRARDERLERDVAIKVLRHGLVFDETARGRFRTEALALSRLNHPNIATIHDFDSDAGIDFLVMEYIPGASLDERVREGSCSDAEVRHIGVQLAHGLRAAHERGVIHGDLKPGNLRLTPDGRLKILDFGLARLLESVSSEEADRTRTMEMAGTLPYLAPERLHGGGIDIRTDIYAVGAVLYELASGQRLFGKARGSELWSAILTEEPEAPRACNPRISEPLDAVIEELPRSRRIRCSGSSLPANYSVIWRGSTALQRNRSLANSGVVHDCSASPQGFQRSWQPPICSPGMERSAPRPGPGSPLPCCRSTRLRSRSPCAFWAWAFPMRSSRGWRSCSSLRRVRRVPSCATKTSWSSLWRRVGF